MKRFDAYESALAVLSSASDQDLSNKDAKLHDTTGTANLGNGRSMRRAMVAYTMVSSAFIWRHLAMNWQREVETNTVLALELLHVACAIHSNA